MLSAAAQAYLIWQVFDHIQHSQHPVRFVDLAAAVPDLAAWPEFREAAMHDPRFVVVGDAIDIATPGIRKYAHVGEIVLQTLNLLRVPLSYQMLFQLVRRVRPGRAGKGHDIERALATGELFPAWTGHFARRQWLRQARPIRLPLTLPGSLPAAAQAALSRAKRPIPAANLAAALADRFQVSITEAYQELGADKRLLFLPGGTVDLYDAVAAEVRAAASAPADRRDGSGQKRAVSAEVLRILTDLPTDVRTDPRVRSLVRLVAAQPRISIREEARLLPAAQQSQGPEWERLVLGHLRYALVYLLHRRDLPMLLPHLEDFFQHAAMGVITAVGRFDRSRAIRLQHILGWPVMTALERARGELLLPVVIPDPVAMLVFLQQARAHAGEEEAQAVSGPPIVRQEVLDFWASATSEPWDGLAEGYEDGALQPTWLTMGEPGPEPVAVVEQADLRRQLVVMLGSMDARSRDVLCRRFGLGGEEESLEEIGRSHGLTRERVRQIEARALERLQIRSRSRRWGELREFLRS